MRRRAHESRDFTARDGGIWTIALWPAFKNLFGVSESDLPEFHELVSKTTLWRLARMRFGIHPTFPSWTADVSTLRVYTISEVARAARWRVGDVDEQLSVLREIFRNSVIENRNV